MQKQDRKPKFCLKTNVNQFIDYILADPERPGFTRKQLLIRAAKLNVLYLGGFVFCMSAAIRIKDMTQKGKDGEQLNYTWRTPVCFGNNARGPIWPYEKIPYIMDTEDYLKFYRQYDLRLLEIILMFRQMRFQGVYHPQREDKDDMTIYDAEHQSDIRKRLEEQRHDMAIKLVQLGVYTNVIKAKEQLRKHNFDKSTYKFKHLLYRD